MKIAKAKALDNVDGLLRTLPVNERHGACRCESSSGLLPTNCIQLVSELENGGCNCDLQLHVQVSYHSWSVVKESVGQHLRETVHQSAAWVQ